MNQTKPQSGIEENEPIIRLIADLRRHGLKFRINGNSLEYDRPPGGLPLHLETQLQEHRNEILETMRAGERSFHRDILPKISIQYADFAHWQRQWLQGEVLARQLTFWKNQLKGAPGCIDLPTDRPRPKVQTHHGDKVDIGADRGLAHPLQRIAKERNTTLFATVLAAWAAFLYRYGAGPDLVIGTPVANRGRASIEPLIGFFANTLPLRVRPSGNDSFTTLLEQSKKICAATWAHQDVPFETMVNTVSPKRSLSHSPLFQVMLVLNDTPVTLPGLGPLSLTPMTNRRTSAKFELTLELVVSGDALYGEIEFNTDLFDRTTIETMASRLNVFLHGIVAEPHQSISRLPLQSPREEQQLLSRIQGKGASSPMENGLWSRFEDVAKRKPHSVALTYFYQKSNQHRTYQALLARTRLLDGQLRRMGIHRHTTVGLCMNRTPDWVATLLAILRSGGTYLNLDPQDPEKRLHFLLENNGVTVLITDQPNRERFTRGSFSVIAAQGLTKPCQPPTVHAARVTGVDPAALVYTPGSSATPTCTVITQRGLMGQALDGIPFSVSENTVTVLSAQNYEASFHWELWAPLLNGGRCVLMNEPGLGAKHQAWVAAKQGVTAICTNSEGVQALSGIVPGFPGKSTKLCLTGTPPTGVRVRELSHRWPTLQVHYGFRPMFIPLFTGGHFFHQGTVTKGQNRIVGIPGNRASYYVLDSEGAQQLRGIPGELHFEAEGWVIGFSGQPALTATTFVPNPFSFQPGLRMVKTGDRVRMLMNGTLVHHGKRHHRGFPLPLNEIETALKEHPLVMGVRADLSQEQSDDPIISCTVAWKPFQSKGPDDMEQGQRPRQLPKASSILARFLGDRLPKQWLPRHFWFAATLAEQDSKGQSLQDLPQTEPRTPLERSVGAIWKDLLGISRLGIHDNFFHLGGHSRLLIQLAQRLAALVPRRPEPAALFNVPTIAQQAELLNLSPGTKTHPLAELRVQYADFATWQRNRLQGSYLGQQLGYWKRKLAATPPLLMLPTDSPRPPIQSMRGDRTSFRLPRNCIHQLRKLGHQHNGSLFMVLLAGYQVLLARYSRSDDIPVGSPIANRTQKETEPLIGFFANTVVLRGDLSGNPTFAELLARTRRTTLEAYAHQDLPFEKLVEELQPERSLDRSPLFQVAFVLENTPKSSQTLTGLTLHPMGTNTVTAKYDLTLHVGETDDGAYAAFEYCADLFDKSTVAQLGSHFRTLLESVVVNPENHVEAIPLLTATERKRHLSAWNQTTGNHVAAEGIHRYFEAWVNRNPDRTALIYEATPSPSIAQVTYDCLNSRANNWARHLQHYGVGPESVVALLMERSTEMMTAILAVLKAGGCYLPLDPEYPQERLTYLIQDAAVGAILTSKELQARLPECGARVFLPQSWGQKPDGNRNLNQVTLAGQPAYLIYTSGSTGKPKGAQLAHNGLCRLAQTQQNLFAVQPSSKILQFASPSFDASVWEWAMALGSGASLCLAHRDELLPGPPLARLLRNQKITHWTVPPQALSRLGEEPFPQLKTIITAGEACTPDLAARFGRNRRFFNAYGPTETTVCATVERCRQEDRKPPIGRPIAGVSVYLLDDHLEPVPTGVPGTLYIGGEGLARGYLRKPALTAKAFIPNPFEQTAGGRLYNTGDLARGLAGGALDFMGRIDHQVKLRGYRIELGEIEHLLAEHHQVREQAVILREDPPGNLRLTAYVVPNAPMDDLPSLLRRQLKEYLPAYMVPSAFVILDQLPLNTHGKVDRQALPAPREQETNVNAPQPRTSTEAGLALIWGDLLNAKGLGPEANFFDLGGHSLLATQVISRILDSFGVQLPIRDLFEAEKLAALASRIDTVVARKRIGKQSRSGSTPGELIDRNQTPLVLPRTPLERKIGAIWKELLGVDRIGINDNFFELGGHYLLLVQLGRRLAKWWRRNAVPNSRLPRPTIAEQVADLDSGTRIKSSPLPKQTIQYADFAAWQRRRLQGEVLEQHIHYWRRQLTGAPRLLELPTDRPRPPFQSNGGDGLSFPLSGSLITRLKAMAHRLHGSLFMVLLSAFYVLLARYSRSEDLVVGSPIANRNRRELEQLIGFFINNLALRCDLSGNPSFTDLVTRVRRTTLDAYAHQDLPFEKLVQELNIQRNLSSTPLFQVVFALQNMPKSKQILPGLTLSPIDSGKTNTKYDLTLFVSEGDGQEAYGHFEYCIDLFEKTTVARMGAHYGALLEAAIRAPEDPIGQLSLLTPNEREQILSSWGQTSSDQPKATTIHGCFEKVAKTLPQRLALIYESPHQQGQVSRISHLSYGFLNRLANSWSKLLRERGVGPEVLVALFLDRSVEMSAAPLAVLKAGGAFLPLDPAYPADRLTFILKDAAPQLILTTEALRHFLPQTKSQILCMDQWQRHCDEEDETFSVQEVSPENLAYVIYTSGSTGRPKGTQLCHRGLCNLAIAQQHFLPMIDHARFLQFASLSFDASVWDWVMAWNSGSCLVLAQRDNLLPGPPLERLLRRQAITHWLAPPSSLALLDGGDFPHLTTVIAGGEACSNDLVARLGRDREFLNAYGPTEITVCATVSNCQVQDLKPTIGRPLNGTTVYLFDGNLQLVPVGIPGTVYIGGAGLARGYLGKPALTAQAFIADPFARFPGGRLYNSGDMARYLPNGEIDYLGRADHQIKLRGYRIELGEIETLLNQLEDVRSQAVIMRQDQPGDPRLTAYLVPAYPSSAEGDDKLIESFNKNLVARSRAELKQKLPNYMVPGAFVLLDQMPLTASGKVNRGALPPPESADLMGHQEHVPPNTASEKQLALLWSEVLGVEQVGVLDNFFELGGHSLLGTQVVSRILNTFGIELPIRDFFESLNLGEMATRIEERVNLSRIQDFSSDEEDREEVEL